MHRPLELEDILRIFCFKDFLIFLNFGDLG